MCVDVRNKIARDEVLEITGSHRTRIHRAVVHRLGIGHHDDHFLIALGEGAFNRLRNMYFVSPLFRADGVTMQGIDNRIAARFFFGVARRQEDQHVAIDGTCASACTLLLGVIPHDRICVTPRAVLAFHAAWDPSLTGAQTNAAGIKYLWSRYPGDVRRWIARHGGLRSQTIYLGGRELAAMFQTCR